MRLVRYAALVAEPWQNGGGLTRVIATGSDAQGLRWRLSLAEISRDGPFCVLVGLERVLTVVAGRGVTLRLPDGPHEVAPLAPFAFAGEVPVMATLAHGPVTAFNLMWRRGTPAPAVTVLRDRADTPGDGQGAVFLVEGGAGWQGSPLNPGDTLIGAMPTLAPGAIALCIAGLDRAKGE